MIQSMHFFFDVITKRFNAIFASIKSKRIINVSVSEFAINTPTRWRVLINFIGVRSIWIWIGRLDQFKDRFKICIHYEWDFKLILSIFELNG